MLSLKRLPVAAFAVSALFGGCSFSEGPRVGEIPDGGPGGVPMGPGVGSPCARDGDCREGLTCHPEMRTCQAARRGIPGASCVLSAECLPGSHCSGLGVCAESGMGAEGATCSSEGDCQSGLVCNLAGIYGTCAKAGTGDVNKACTQTTDCLAGLLCAVGKCQPLRAVQPWLGAACPSQQDPVVKALFRVPRTADAPSDDYYRLPFPNDIRKKSGKLDLANHPKPGQRLLPIDPVKLYIDAIVEDGVGFGTNPTVTFRFSRPPNTGTFGDGVVAFYDITPGHPGYGYRLGHLWDAMTGGTRYVCPQMLRVRPPNWGTPLRPGHTYAVVLTKGFTDDSGAKFGRDSDFDAVMGSTMPTDADLAAAWQAYEPLRKFLADPSVEAERKPKAEDIVVAAVFTTDKVDEPVAKLYAAVQAAPAPAVMGMVKCAAGVTSPCAGGKSDVGETRGCPATEDAAFDEYQGKVTIPGFQKGKVPFDLPTDGGGIDATPTVQRTEEVCVSLTVPKGAAPAAGWPVVLYGHGTGGSYRSHVESGLAADFAGGDIDAGAKLPMAMLGYDGVLHGTRKGGSTKATSELVFNYLNPRAARDNPLQAAADLFALARALKSWSAGGVRIDGNKIALYGHSQGGNAGALAAGYEPAFGVVVLSGTGGGLIPSMLAKKNPVSVAGALPVVLSDGSVDDKHAVLNLLQMYFDRADPLNFARQIVVEPPTNGRPKNFLHLVGSDDTYAPDATQEYFGMAAALGVVAPVGKSMLTVIDTVPVVNNQKVGMFEVTAAQTQYKPSGYDGHFVSTRNASARRSLRQMIGTYLRDGKATVAP